MKCASVKAVRVVWLFLVVTGICVITLYQSGVLIFPEQFSFTKNFSLFKTYDMQDKNMEDRFETRQKLIEKTNMLNISLTQSIMMPTYIFSLQNFKPDSEYFHLSKDETSHLNEALKNATERV